MNPVQHNQEAVANTVLAQLLTQRGLDAQAETTVNRRRPDIIITRTRHGNRTYRIYLETEYEPAVTVDDDAKSRLQENMPDGASFQRLVAFAIKLPETLKSADQQFLTQRFQDAALKWRVWYAFRDPRKPNGKLQFSVGRPETGKIDELVRAVRTVEAEVYDLERAVDELEKGACEAGAQLISRTIRRLAKNVFKNEKYNPVHDAEETAQLSALIVINAMMFHERLASRTEEPLREEDEIPPLPLGPTDEKSWQQAVLDAWSVILGVDYKPIFKMARDVVETLNSTETMDFLSIATARAKLLVELTKIGSHDLAGHIFNRLVADRKFIAAYYTRIPTATLLAGLALAPQRWKDLDWTDAATLEDFRVLDPACGTGTLLMAAYKQIEANAKIADLNDADKRRAFHKTMVETAIHGFDVVHVALHLAAATLASISPDTLFKKMHLAAPKFGVAADGAMHLGSLDFLDSNIAKTSFRAADENGAQSKFEEAQEVVKPDSLEKDTVAIPQADLIIANPPYTRHESDTGEGKLKSRIFGQFEKDWDILSKQLSKKLSGTDANQFAGLASAFIVLADKYVKPNGRIAFVLPSTALTGTSWADLRGNIAERYDVEFVISAQIDISQSLSFDTHITEVLLIARKLVNGDEPPRQAIFINLSSLPADAYEANLLVREINKIADKNAIRKISDAPVGGTPVGGQFLDKRWRASSRWGEAIVAPVNGETWGGAVWQTGVAGQYVWNLYKKGVLWNNDGTRAVNRFDTAQLGAIANIGPHHRQVKAKNAPFEIYDTFDSGNQLAAIWHHEAKTVKTMQQEPNAHLEPKTDSNYKEIWRFAGNLHIPTSFRYNSQSQGAVYTPGARKTLGVNSWSTLTFKDAKKASAYETVMALWLNSTLGLCCRIAHSSHSQIGRGHLSVTSLQTLPVLDVTKLKGWQLNAAQKIWNDLKDKPFRPVHLCDADKTRIELDDRLLKEVFGLNAGATAAAARIRELLAREPTIHGGRKQS